EPAGPNVFNTLVAEPESVHGELRVEAMPVDQFLAVDPHLAAQPEQPLALRAKVAKVAVSGLSAREHVRIRLHKDAPNHFARSPMPLGACYSALEDHPVASPEATLRLAAEGVREVPVVSVTLAAALAGITLPDADGHEVRIGSLWESGPGVLVFL